MFWVLGTANEMSAPNLQPSDGQWTRSRGIKQNISNQAVVGDGVATSTQWAFNTLNPFLGPLHPTNCPNPMHRLSPASTHTRPVGLSTCLPSLVGCILNACYLTNLGRRASPDVSTHDPCKHVSGLTSCLFTHWCLTGQAPES